LTAPRTTPLPVLPGQPGIVIRLPNPCLVVLVGAAGSGKSTLARRLFPAGTILSSDAYREQITGDAADQRVTRAAFSRLHADLERRMAARLGTVVDATNVTAFARRSLLRRAAAHDVPAVAIVLDLSPPLVLSRNATRAKRIVPETAVRRQLSDLGRSVRHGELADEGFASVHHVRTAEELDGLRVVPA
jgi:protein phosphatase